MKRITSAAILLALWLAPQSLLQAKPLFAYLSPVGFVGIFNPNNGSHSMLFDGGNVLKSFTPGPGGYYTLQFENDAMLVSYVNNDASYTEQVGYYYMPDYSAASWSNGLAYSPVTGLIYSTYSVYHELLEDDFILTTVEPMNYMNTVNTQHAITGSFNDQPATFPALLNEQYVLWGFQADDVAYLVYNTDVTTGETFLTANLGVPAQIAIGSDGMAYFTVNGDFYVWDPSLESQMPTSVAMPDIEATYGFYWEGRFYATDGWSNFYEWDPSDPDGTLETTDMDPLGMSYFYVANVVPEPATTAFMTGAAVLTLAFILRRRRRA